MRRAASSTHEARPDRKKRICPPQTRYPAQICHNQPLEAWLCRTSSPLIFPRSGSWGTRSSSPSTVRPFAASGPRVRGHSRFFLQRTDPVPATSVQHFTLHQPKQGRRGLSFVVEGVSASRPSSTPHLRYVFPCNDTLLSSISFHSRMGASTGYRCGFSAQFGPATHFSLGEIPPASTGFS